jgi:predicted nucleotide-binding protein (sugar kinase/HSP70/actin superfamily)
MRLVMTLEHINQEIKHASQEFMCPHDDTRCTPVVVRNIPRSMDKSLRATQSFNRARDNTLCHMQFWREHSNVADMALEQLSFVSSTTLG